MTTPTSRTAPAAAAERVLAVPTARLRHHELVRIVRTAEEQGHHALLLEDHGAEGADPIAAACALAPLTSALRLVPVVDTSRQHPFGLARRLTALQQVSAGRAGWAPRDDVAERLEEAVHVIRALWDSWPEDAVVGDKERAVWVDTDRVRTVSFHGLHYRVEAPADLPRSTYGSPRCYLTRARAHLDPAAVVLDDLRLERVGEVAA